MAAQLSAGLLMCRLRRGQPEFFLVHPGGPFFRNKELGAWSIPKGLPEPGEDLLAAAQREFKEETGLTPSPPFLSLGVVRQKNGKQVHAWCFKGEWDPATGITCNSFSLEWPPRSGRYQEFPEQDKAAWMDHETALRHLIPEQHPLLDRATALIRGEV